MKVMVPVGLLITSLIVCEADLYLNSPEWLFRQNGMYGELLRLWYSKFSKEQFLILKQEELRDLTACFQRVCRFLEIDDSRTPPSINKSKAKSAIRSLRRLRLHHNVALSMRKTVSDSGHTEWRSPQSIYRFLAYAFNRFDGLVLSNVLGDSAALQASQEAMDKLRVLYADDIESCATLTGMDLSSWLTSK